VEENWGNVRKKSKKGNDESKFGKKVYNKCKRSEKP
jgi:hypothetical protein